MAGSPNVKRVRKPHPRRWPTADLDRLIEEAIVDAYGESEQTVGFFTMLEEHLAMPFPTKVFETGVVVERLDLTADERIVAVCSRGRSHQRIGILDPPIPNPPPSGAEWIEAYRRWSRHGTLHDDE
jgi:hypothetical protein